MITINDAKDYIYVPASVTIDDMAIHGFILAAYAYLRGAIDDFDKLYETNDDFECLADLFAVMYVAELYQQRNQYSTGSSTPSFLVKALMTQMQTYTYNEENNEGDKNNG